MSNLLRTPLYDWHVAHGGRMVEFGGWDMPVQYTGIVDEHHAVRKRAGLFDISHMGRLRFRGDEADRFLNHVLTNNVASLEVGQVRYSLVCHPAGGILDDVLVYRLPDAYWLVVNASNRTKIVNWCQDQINGFAVEMEDLTLSTGMLAVQGPLSAQSLPGDLGHLWSGLKYYSAVELPTDINSGGAILSRTGYTGEDGFELIVPAEELEMVCELLMGVPWQDSSGIQPCGLGARDTLRLEAAMPLYGHELSETIDPLTAGLDFAVKFDKPDFIGKAALVEIARKTDRPLRVGLELAGRRIAREGSAIYVAENQIGTVTSGTFSPTRERSIAMAYIAPEQAGDGTPLEVDIRGKRESATVVPLPFYRRAK